MMNINMPNRINVILFITTLFLSLMVKFTTPVWTSFGDPYDYLQQSHESLSSKEFYFPTKRENFSPRPFTVPLLYKVANSDPETIIQMQKFFHALSTFFLCYVLLLFFKNEHSKYVFLFLWYLLMSWWNILGWTHTLISESLSISFMFFWIASFLLLFYKRSAPYIILHIIITILFSFTRDSWPYILVLFYGIFAVIAFKWDRKILVSVIGLFIISCAIFVIQQKTAQIGQRYKLPIMNNIVYRILPNEKYTEWFANKGMPCIDQLKKQFSNVEDSKMIYPLYNDTTYAAFFDWVVKDGKSTYTKFLFTHPAKFLLIGEKSKDLKRIFAYNIGYTGGIKGYSWISKYIFPLFNTITILILNGLLIFLFIKEKRLVWLFPSVTIIIFTANAFLLYIADSMEVERHLFITNIIIQFVGILLVSFILDSEYCNNSINKMKSKYLTLRKNTEMNNRNTDL